jgi:hypothetical protein
LGSLGVLYHLLITVNARLVRVAPAKFSKFGAPVDKILTKLLEIRAFLRRDIVGSRVFANEKPLPQAVMG